MNNEKINCLYIDCRNSGISGDMFVAALLSLIPNSKDILIKLNQLKDYLKGVSNLNIDLKRVKKNDIWVYQLQIALNESKHHRKVSDLREALNKFSNKYIVGEKARKYANDVLDMLIKGESEVHGELEEKLHLHELSSVDTLIDILGAALCLEQIGVFNEEFSIYCSELPIGGGKVKTAHGLIPVPAPVVVKTLEESNLKALPGPIQEEISTPTGVSLLANLHPIIGNFPFKIHKMAQSMGQKKFPNFLNILRIYTGYFEKKSKGKMQNGLLGYQEKITILETNIDDISGEIIGDFMEVISKKNVLDVQIVQSLTKKNRPSYIIKVLCNPEFQLDIVECLFTHLGTLGVRYYTIDRICIDREMLEKTVDVKGKEYLVHFKLSYYILADKKTIVNAKPEYDDLRRIREDTGLSIRKITQIIQPTLENVIKKKKK
ncbi:MAG: nickel pincer cofactor biosynthesis protein LarC [Promethearchaeota archaeon]|nr:MAG: nickel pincer cofactor biosynthesis protein LarC [Candidatus Lokiarchaeota archaeon]